MNSTTSTATSMFEKVLRSFETHGIAYSDVLTQLRRLLAGGAQPTELLAVLRRRESVERLPEYARVEALLLEAERGAAQKGEPDSAPDRTEDQDSGDASELDEAASTIPIPDVEPEVAAPEPARPQDEVTVDLDFDPAGRRVTPSKGLRASELDLSVLAEHLRSVDERPPRVAALERLAHPYQRTSDGESAAAERASALAADLQAARALLQAEQGRVREIEQALSRSVASAEAARAEALRESHQLRAELRTLRDSLAQRDAQVATLTRKQSILETTLEARSKAAPELRPELNPARLAGPGAADREHPTERAIPRAELEESRPPHRNWMRRPARAIGWGAAAVLLAVFAWLFAHRSPPAPTAAPSPPLPNPGSVIRDCADCPEMTVLPPGRFEQGSAGSAFAQPPHSVVISRQIAMSTNPVTVQDFRQFVAATGRDMQGCDTYDGDWKQRPGDSWESPGFAQTDTHPVTCVSWNDAEAYAKWLSAKTGHRYRLPSASEWEYAARAGSEAAQPWSQDGQDACADANVADTSAQHRYPGWTVFPCDDGYVYTAPVGSFKANAFGLNDMLGNVLQWTGDCWDENYLGAPMDGSARSDGDCSLHEIRGGSWFSNPSYVRTDYRDRFPADYRTSSVGIRLVRDI